MHRPPVLTRQSIESATPKVTATGFYSAVSGRVPGIADLVGTGRVREFSVRPVLAETLYVNQAALHQYRLGHLLNVRRGHGERRFPVDQRLLGTLADWFAVRIPAEQSRPPGGDIPLHALSSQPPTGSNPRWIRGTSTLYGQSEGNLGDARGAYVTVRFPDGSVQTLFVKGIGQTPCCDPEHADTNHTDGYLALHGAFPETVWSEVYANLFTLPTPRTVAVFDIHDYRSGFDARVPSEEGAVVLLRGGLMLRPAHFIETSVYRAYGAAFKEHKAAETPLHTVPDRIMEVGVPTADLRGGTIDPVRFMHAAAATGVLQYRFDEDLGSDVPDLRATFRTIIDRYALTFAEQLTWRHMQSAPSAGNAELHGALFDLDCGSPQDRTSPMMVLHYTIPFGRPEQVWRMAGLRMVFDSLRLNLSPEEQKRYGLEPIDWVPELMARYQHHLGTQLLKAAGLKAAVARLLVETEPTAVRALSETVQALIALENPGEIPLVMGKDGTVLPDAREQVAAKSVVDIFGFFGRFAARFFREDGRQPTLDDVLTSLEPIYGATGDAASQQRREVAELARRLLRIYCQLMTSAQEKGAGYYDSAKVMRADVTARAAFRNQPLSDVFYWNLRTTFLNAVAEKDPATGHTALAQRDRFWRLVHSRIERSLRNIDALLRDRAVVVHSDNNIDVGVTEAGNTTYGVQANLETGARTLFVQVPIGTTATGTPVLNMLGDDTALPSLAGAMLLYTCTQNGTVTDGRMAGTEVTTPKGQRALRFELPLEQSAYGLFEGRIAIPHSGVDTAFSLLEYAYAAPDGMTVLDRATAPTVAGPID